LYALVGAPDVFSQGILSLKDLLTKILQQQYSFLARNLTAGKVSWLKYDHKSQIASFSNLL